MKYTNILFALFCSLNAFGQKNCNIINPTFTPLTELGNGYFRGFQGGLYPGGFNTPQGQYLQNLISISSSIQALDVNGNVSSNGKIVMIGVGASNPRTEFQAFQNINDTYSLRNQKLITVNTCIGGQGVQKMNTLASNYWKTADKTMDSMGLNNLQVQIAWIETEHTASADSAFPSGPKSLVNDMRQLLKTLKQKYPNLKICYLSARAYAGWINNSTGRGLEFPRDYYNGWAMKWLIDSAINQVPGYNYMGQNSDIPMPVYSTYSWTNGEQMRSDGFSFDCDLDVGGDGLHLTPAGEAKIGAEIFKFFSSNTITKQWFNQSSTTTISSFSKDNLKFYPNPGNGFITIENALLDISEIKVFNLQQQCIYSTKPTEANLTLDLKAFDSGIYYIEFTSSSGIAYHKYLKMN